MNGPPIIGAPKAAGPVQIQGPDGAPYLIQQVAVSALNDGITIMLVQEITRNVVWNLTERMKDRCHFPDPNQKQKNRPGDGKCWVPRCAHNKLHDFVEPPAPQPPEPPKEEDADSNEAAPEA